MPTLMPEREKTIVLSRGVAHVRNFAGLDPVQVSTAADVQRSVEDTSEPSLWISFEEVLTNAILRSVRWPSKPLGHALLLHGAKLKSMAALRQCFDRVAFCTDGGFLDDAELCEVLKSPRRDELFIGGIVDDASHTVTLWRGNRDNITVPFSAFPRSGDGIAPDFSRLAITDCGQTVQFGEYEASTDSILYEYDPEYRRKVKNNLLQQDSSFGGSIRRLRKQKQLRRSDFAPLSEKTVARIERGEIDDVHAKTKGILAKKLGVKPEMLGTF